MAHGARHFVAAAALAAVTAYAALYGSISSPPPIHSDGYSYFVYLPSVFIYRDITLDALANEWYGGPYPAYTGLRRWPSTGHWVNLHPIGTAMLMTPFFLVSDVLSVWSNLPRDGFSLCTISTAPGWPRSPTFSSAWSFSGGCCGVSSAKPSCSRR